MDEGAEEDMEINNMVAAVVMDVMAEEDVGEGDMVITHMDFPSGTENSWHRNVYTLQTNGDSSPCNKIIIFKK